MSPRNRLDERFVNLKLANRAGLISFVTAGDPDLQISLELLKGLPSAGVDIIEIGMPFSDPMADGPAIQAANIRAFHAGITLKKVLELVRGFRLGDGATPVVLMGYYNPIYTYGVETFLKDARDAGVDGFIVVDLPPEEVEEFSLPSKAYGLNFINLITPTTDEKRLPAVLKHASGFLYYVSMAGVTGTKQIDASLVRTAVGRLRKQTALPVAVGFGITNPEQARAVAEAADAVVVGSAIVQRIAASLDDAGKPNATLVEDVLGFVAKIADAVHSVTRAV